MNTKSFAIAAAIIVGIAAPTSSAMAFDYESRRTAPYDVETTGSLGVHDSPKYTSCPMSSAAEGNANQQNFPVKQYGQTAGGPRC
ncbi:MAG TPA: hypothetical protein VGU70_20300 [Methylobacterium sp.]|jgi:hypothetical protein|uniref:hypothetical protein n=1 Tax=Methylorubrum sp. B1-46 TaxID=2897334 RepID=UPI001E3729D3|nr:hypothetical protein [Methylorubrum sp. B1-46]UGB26589.1 hypothetical protein LPC10_02935 [Methylorubrum sp. B1-46]HEV2545098.1 hypothetical protein [Methylobacterium sp.]